MLPRNLIHPSQDQATLTTVSYNKHQHSCLIMRTLPWKRKGGSSTVTHQKKSIASIGRSTKRSRDEASPSDSHEGSDHPRKQIPESRSREPSTSPPLEPPVESFMIEGREHDDEYRMVEDELLTVAKSFTVHLHTAEYKRLGKIANTRNADAINSISRPVVGRMPDATRRKTEEVTRSNDQRNILEKLVGKKKGSF
ncbi:d4f6aa4f-fb24-4fa9-9b0f-eb32cd9545a4 [Sclerotinia trifoliorum]|uniref:D4f6aa4f-fb24-4fa9-9b0f-eb32cd9545a4 n=1 Tax=Sclerotinia trifoliorum TaxID=28548 RepID=A0A8H2VN04_9HELO|nr:d4f6aa4f-fb24-4fa9-9b0f-eb32cd9545a4 [Sclerotinia trifoliorum]